jgi:hypothetical protein
MTTCWNTRGGGTLEKPGREGTQGQGDGREHEDPAPGGKRTHRQGVKEERNTWQEGKHFKTQEKKMGDKGAGGKEFDHRKRGRKKHSTTREKVTYHIQHGYKEASSKEHKPEKTNYKIKNPLYWKITL